MEQSVQSILQRLDQDALLEVREAMYVSNTPVSQVITLGVSVRNIHRPVSQVILGHE